MPNITKTLKSLLATDLANAKSLLALLASPFYRRDKALARAIEKAVHNAVSR